MRNPFRKDFESLLEEAGTVEKTEKLLGKFSDDEEKRSKIASKWLDLCTTAEDLGKFRWAVVTRPKLSQEPQPSGEIVEKLNQKVLALAAGISTLEELRYLRNAAPRDGEADKEIKRRIAEIERSQLFLSESAKTPYLKIRSLASEIVVELWESHFAHLKDVCANQLPELISLLEKFQEDFAPEIGQEKRGELDSILADLARIPADTQDGKLTAKKDVSEIFERVSRLF